jgi:hypothetical protein
MPVRWHQNEIVLSKDRPKMGSPLLRDPRLTSLVNGSVNQTYHDNQECVTCQTVLAISREGLGWIWRFGILSMIHRYVLRIFTAFFTIISID